MIDLVLNRRLDNCRILMQAWNKFHSYLTACMKREEFTRQQEADFLRLKSQIAILHDSFLEAADLSLRESAATSQSIIALVERSILLRQVAKLNSAELKRMEMEWHEAYLLINDTIGILEEEIARLSKISRFHHNVERFIKKIGMETTHVLTHRGFQVGVLAIVVIVLAVVLPLVGVFSYDLLNDYKYTRGAYWVTCNVIRKFLKDFEYRTWEDYVKHGRGSLHYLREVNMTPDKEAKMRDFFIIRAPLNLTAEVQGGTAKAVKYERTDRVLTIGTACFFFRSTFEATALQTKYNLWKDALPKPGPAADVENNIRCGRSRNVVFFIYCTHVDEAFARVTRNEMAGMLEKGN